MNTPAPSSPGEVPAPDARLPFPPPLPLPIADDLACVHCGYNLRTRTSADCCPECGTPIAQTLDHLQQAAGILLEERAFRVASLLFAALCIGAVPVYASQAFLESSLAARLSPSTFSVANPIAMTIIHIFFLAVLLTATLLFFASFSERIASAGIRSLTTIVTMLYTLLGAPLTLATFARFMRFRFFRFAAARGGGTAFLQYRIGVSLVTVFLFFVGFLCFRRLADAIASEPLKRTAQWVFALMFVQALLPLAIFGLMGTYDFRWGWVIPNSHALIAPDFLSAVACSVFAWFWLFAAGIFRRPRVQSTAAPASPPPPSPGEKISRFLKRRR